MFRDVYSGLLFSFVVFVSSAADTQPRIRRTNSTPENSIRHPNLKRSCDDQLINLILNVESRLKSEILQEVKGENMALQDLLAFVQSGLRSQITNSTTSQDLKIVDLSTRVALVIAALRTLSSDVAYIKNSTLKLLERFEEREPNRYALDSTYEREPEPQDSYRISEIFPQKSFIPKSCLDIKYRGKGSGIYRIQPEDTKNPFMVSCDMDTRGGGWTVIHERFNGSQDFYRDWNEYKIGFGNLGGEFWLGLDYIYDLTGHEVNELLIELEDDKNERRYALYEAFSIGPESEGYTLKVLSGYEGDAGDSLMYHAGSRFSTKDRDNDSWIEGSCSQAHHGAWWYKSCDTSNLNGGYFLGVSGELFKYQGMYWNDFGGPLYSLLKARMLVRPKT